MDQGLTPARACVFISYSRKDGAFVDRLASALSVRGHEVLLDRESIAGGEAWRERLEGLILQSDAVAFVLSPHSVASPTCDWEIERTLELGKRLVPVCLERVEESPASIARLNYVFADADDRFEQAVVALSGACDVDIAWVREHTRLTAIAKRWDSTGRALDALTRGEELKAAEAWLARRAPLMPVLSEDLLAYLQGSRDSEVAQLERQRRTLSRVRRLQAGIGGLIAIAAAIVIVAGLGTARLVAGLSERNSASLAGLANIASDAGDYDRSARLALAGVANSDGFAMGFDARLAEAELRRAVINGRLVGVLHQPGSAQAVAFSPDGSRLIMASFSDTAGLWSVQDGRQIAQLRGHQEIVEGVAYDPRGRLIATAGGTDGSVRIWSAIDGAPLRTLSQDEEFLARVVVFSADGRMIAAATKDAVELWDTTSFSVVRSFSASNVRRIAFTDDGSHILITPYNGTATLRSVTSGALLTSFPNVADAVISPDGVHVVTSPQQAGRPRLHDIAEGTSRLLMEDFLSDEEMSELAFSPDGRWVLTGSDRGGYVWNVATGRLHRGLYGHAVRVYSAAFSPDGERIVTGDWGGVVREWRVATGELLAVNRGHTGSATSVAYSPDGDLIASFTNEFQMRLWRSADAPRVDFAAPQDRSVVTATHGRAGGAVLLSFEDHSARVYSTRSGEVLLDIVGHRGLVSGASFDDERERLATTAQDGSVRLWRTDTWLPLALAEDEGRLGARLPAFAPDGRFLAVAYRDNSVRVLASDDLRPIQELPAQEAGIASLMVLPNGEIVTGDDRGVVRIWELDRATPVRVLRGSDEPAGSEAMRRGARPIRTALAGSGRLLVGATPGHPSRVWEIATGREVVRFEGQRAGATALAVSRDGRLAATGARDGSVFVWRVEDGSVVSSSRYESQDPFDFGVMRLEFGPDGAWLLAVSGDRYARWWDVATGRELNSVELTTSDPAVMLSPDGRSALFHGGGQAWMAPLDEALWMGRRDLMGRACRSLRNNLSIFTQDDYRRSPALDPALDLDACTPPSIVTRLSAILRGE